MVPCATAIGIVVELWLGKKLRSEPSNPQKTQVDLRWDFDCMAMTLAKAMAHGDGRGQRHTFSQRKMKKCFC